VPGVSSPNGGLVMPSSSLNTLIIGGSANTANAQLFSINVVRGEGGHITGFSGTASSIATAQGGNGGGIDGGLAYGPNNVLFYTSYSDNYIGEIRPGSSGPDKLVYLTSAGVDSSVGTLAFVPNGFGGAGHLKIISYSSSGWFDATVTPDGNGTFDINVSGSPIYIGGGPEGVIFVPAGNPLFPVNSILVAAYKDGAIYSFELDSNGDPIFDTKRVFMSGLGGAEGAFVDPVTGDFLFSTFNSGNRVIEVNGFTVVPEPSTWTTLSLGLGGLMCFLRRRK
jgi:hypothetical protein